ncbi:flavodoxin domain-containing protein [Arenimonas sp.]|uniref:flavodoxin domain-containing protein n=1 Tax=Arenimonas sp. TaxID=1872635 RepID=UPI0039E381E9
MALTKSFAGNAIALLSLLGVGAIFGYWQTEAWWNASPPPARWLWAGAWLVAYALLCFRFLHRRAPRLALVASAPDDATILVAWASQTGFAQQLAEHTVVALTSGGIAVDLLPLHQVDHATLQRYRRALFIASTTGEGDPPDHALAFTRDLMSADARLPDVEYAVLALGDSNYSHYCAFGRELDHWLHRSGARALFDRIDVDAADAGALRHWQHHLGQLCGRTDLPDWSAPAYSPWRLQARIVLNEGSPGASVHHLELSMPVGESATWRAGDIAEVGPLHASAEVREWLDAAGLDGETRVRHDDEQVSLQELLRRSRLIDAGQARGRSEQAVADSLQALPHREYSIASIPDDGSLQLLVREMRDAQGRLGLGSGWLTQHAQPGEAIALRIRRNPGFHVPEGDRPMVLIGNGTGIAGLRALLKERTARGRHGNWLLFGERSATHDTHYASELAAWLREWRLSRLDLCYSRSTLQCPLGEHAQVQVHAGYVQEALLQNGGPLREWIREGASIHVCGSLAGMAPGVDAALRQLLGNDETDALMAAGRYRRDVY